MSIASSGINSRLPAPPVPFVDRSRALAQALADSQNVRRGLVSELKLRY